MAIAGQYALETNARRVPATMLAAVYRGVNEVRLETVPVPEIGAGEMLVRVHSCGVCGTDLKKISTGSHSAPRIFGHETSGVVAAVGEAVREHAPGVVSWYSPMLPPAKVYTARTRPLPSAPLIKKSAVPRDSNLPAAALPNTSASWTGSSNGALSASPTASLSSRPASSNRSTLA